MKKIKYEIKKLTVKKNYFDNVAASLYCLGCFLIHTSLFVAMFFVKLPDSNKAKYFDEDYRNKLKKVDPSNK